jgi:hypothetical protein
MDQQLVRDTIVYLGMIFATVVAFSLLLWAMALVCRRRAGSRRCTGALTVVGLVVGLPLWSILMQAVVPGHEFLGPWWWFAFVAVPATFCVLASLLILWRVPDRPWRTREHVRAALGSFLCGLLGLVLVWQNSDHVWGWATSMAGCGPIEGTANWIGHREEYRRMWWGDPEAWFTTKCAGELDAKIANARELNDS